ncbi:ABC transporter substrate-binding protein [Limobrevibacterium gyesilva]|uniref:ABC transporter substrate-binding protein n=1 Tax=Limobrevibacterium gyesilva TaxID=2991712 RepID=A0AA41YK60_9PROT|nr:ABC transporter substrate-binding protein [Limobrevibacterium gyesilva]MCW3474759.1 ABC transporter substrate-binding protein [Limobrevibacterium gyesilva]
MTDKTFALTRRALVGGAAMGLATAAHAQGPANVKVGLIVPLSGLYARPGAVMRMGAEMGIADVNAAGGVKALGGAKLQLVALDCGDTVEKAKNAAQRMVAQETDLVAATGSYLSSFTLAVSEVTERAGLPLLTLSYSDLLTERGFRHIFQTSATAAAQSELGLPELMKLAEAASGKRPKTVAIAMDNTGTSIATAKALKEKLFPQLGLQLVMDEVWTPPLTDATAFIQKVRSTRPDLFLFMPNAISDAKLGLEKLNEFGLGQGRIPTISFSITIAEPDMLQSVSPDVVQGIMTIVANWGVKGQEKLLADLKAKYKEPWMTQNVVSTYGDMWIVKEALEKAGKADRAAVSEALHTLDAGPAKYFPGGVLKFDDKGRRIGAGVVVVQWQNGVPATVYPNDLAVATPFWPKHA